MGVNPAPSNVSGNCSAQYSCTSSTARAARRSAGLPSAPRTGTVGSGASARVPLGPSTAGKPATSALGSPPDTVGTPLIGGAHPASVTQVSAAPTALSSRRGPGLPARAGPLRSGPAGRERGNPNTGVIPTSAAAVVCPRVRGPGKA
ncbi:hypothetical protein GCM10027174_17910 [Salinifilum aidingensis]